MDIKKFSQKEVDRIVAVRIKRERERLTKEFETKMKRCMASIHLLLYQEMCALKRDMTDEMHEPFVPSQEPNERSSQPISEHPAKRNQRGERQ